MKKLTNNYSDDISFTELDEAKHYYYSDVEPSEEDYIGDDFKSYLRDFRERNESIKNAKSLEDLARALNYMTDTFADGSEWKVTEIV